MSPQAITPQRRRLYGAVHAGAKALGWSDDTYRDVLRVRYGVSSSKRLTDAQLRDLIEYMRSQGFGKGRSASASRASGEGPPGAGRAQNREASADRFAGPSPRTAGGGPLQAKIRALWLACWNLGVVRDRGDHALAKFIARQTGKEVLRFLTAAEANKIIEALKAMAERPYDKGGAGVDWNEDGNPRVCVARAQWRRLAALGAARIADPAALDAWLQWNVAPGRTSLDLLSDAQLDEAIAKLGAWLRAKLKATRDGRA